MYTPGRAVKVASVIVSYFFALGIFFAAVVVVSIAVGVARHGNSLQYGNSLDVPVRVADLMVVKGPAGGLTNPVVRGLPDVRFTGTPKAVLSVENPTTGEMLVRSAEDVVTVVLLLAGALLLRGFLRSVLDGEPFGDHNTRRLRRLGALLVVGVPLAMLIRSQLEIALFDAAAKDTRGVSGESFHLPGGAIAAGIAVYVLAEVFAYGMRLREDVEATV